MSPTRRALALALAAVLSATSPVEAQDTATIQLDVSGLGLVAHVVRPAGPGRYPAVLLVGGSGGGIGWQDQMAQLLAERGVVGMALAYFRMPGLADELERIPLEYMDQGLTLLRAQPYIDSTRLGIGGVSKGGELALLVASLRPEIRAVAAFVPSGVVFQSITPTFRRTSSWSHRGQELPFVPYGEAPRGSPLVEYYRQGLARITADSLEAATIKVERISGPILLLSGRDDTLWPSTALADMIVDRLAAKGFSHAVEHIAYQDAGHLISSIRDSVTRMGGTDAGNRAAQLDGRRRFLEFFETHLATPGD